MSELNLLEAARLLREALSWAKVEILPGRRIFAEDSQPVLKRIAISLPEDKGDLRHTFLKEMNRRVETMPNFGFGSDARALNGITTSNNSYQGMLEEVRTAIAQKSFDGLTIEYLESIATKEELEASKTQREQAGSGLGLASLLVLQVAGASGKLATPAPDFFMGR